MDLDSNSVEDDLLMLLDKLQATGITQVLQVDLKKPEFDIAVVRIVIPGLETPHDDDGYVPGERALKAQAKVHE
jgi:ribosomal protein S12 methylthiotransferase accessory factor YcaO